jgi:RNA polymerase-binding transcription factor DksA
MSELCKDTGKRKGKSESEWWSLARQRLVNRKQELLERLHSVGKDLERESDPTGPDWNERASQRSNDEVLAALGAAGMRELEAIDVALRRIGLGTYGTCARCGKPIPSGRLRALPHVDHCERCAEKCGE